MTESESELAENSSGACLMHLTDNPPTSNIDIDHLRHSPACELITDTKISRYETHLLIFIVMLFAVEQLITDDGFCNPEARASSLSWQCVSFQKSGSRQSRKVFSPITTTIMIGAQKETVNLLQPRKVNGCF